MTDTRDKKPLSPPAEDPPSQPDRSKGREISGPGAADFLTAPGGLDRPETSRDKGAEQTDDETLTSDARRLVPNLDPAGEHSEKKWESEEGGRREKEGGRRKETEDRR